MIIYCAGPIKGDITFQERYKEIIKIVETLGHTALSEFGTQVHSVFPLNDKQIYTRDIKWIDNSNLMIAEISGPSLGVGFEVAYALFVKKIPVLAVYNREAKNVSAMIKGCTNENLTLKKYSNSEDLEKTIKNYLINYKSN